MCYRILHFTSMCAFYILNTANGQNFSLSGANLAFTFWEQETDREDIQIVSMILSGSVQENSEGLRNTSLPCTDTKGKES